MMRRLKIQVVRLPLNQSETDTLRLIKVTATTLMMKGVLLDQRKTSALMNCRQLFTK